LINPLAKALLIDLQLVDRLENRLEWTISLIITLFFAMLAWLWKRVRFRLRAISKR